MCGHRHQLSQKAGMAVLIALFPGGTVLLAGVREERAASA
jgi:hypothetical protein